MTMLRRIIAIPVALLVALLVQVVIVNRAPLPGGVAPDLVLLVVSATGSVTGPLTGMLTGFVGGLAVDVAPPGGHLAGEFALIFCLVGYACGRLRVLADPMEEHATVTSLALTAIGAAVGEAAKAGLGLMLSDPDVTRPAVQRLLPGAVVYDLLLSPFVLWLLVAAITFSLHERLATPYQSAPRTAAQYGAVRVATAGAPAKLRLSGGPSAASPRAPGLVGKEPRLRLAGSTSPALSRQHSSMARGLSSPAARKPVPVNFSGSSGLLGGGLMGGTSMLGVGGLGGAGLGGAGLGRAMGPSLFSGSPLRRSGPGKGWLKSPGLAASSPAANWRGSGPGKGWLSAGSGRHLFRQRGPAPKLATPGRGWARGSGPARATRRLASPGKGWLSVGKPRYFRGNAQPVKRKSPSFKHTSSGFPKGGKRSSPGRGWLNGSGAGRTRAPYRASTVRGGSYISSAMPSRGFRRRRRLRIGGRG
jgi:rod shape-determining protein MreD